jgi:hypothetical protein
MGNVNTVVNIVYENSTIIRTVNDGYNSSKIKIPATEVDKVNFSKAEWDNIENNPKEIDYCLIENYNSINECAGLFRKNDNDNYIEELDRFRLEYGSKCYSLKFRPGICIDPKHKHLLDEAYIEAIEGKKCKIVYQDYNYNNDDLKRCCYTDNKLKCNANLINNYTTNHCNGVMVENCEKDMGNPRCIKWLEQSYTRLNNEALELYQDWCSNNFDSELCTYFCKVARNNNDYRSEYCDTALKNWCKKNSYNENCMCLYTPNSIIPEVEEYLGPKECWLSQCSSQNNSKWLTTDQLNTRKKCSVTNCVININQLTLNENASAEFINDCISGGNGGNITLSDNKNIEYKKTPSTGFNAELLLGSFLLILIHLCT